jgi:hypothetical protein
MTSHVITNPNKYAPKVLLIRYQLLRHTKVNLLAKAIIAKYDLPKSSMMSPSAQNTPQRIPEDVKTASPEYPTVMTSVHRALAASKAAIASGEGFPW